MPGWENWGQVLQLFFQISLNCQGIYIEYVSLHCIAELRNRLDTMHLNPPEELICLTEHSMVPFSLQIGWKQFSFSIKCHCCYSCRKPAVIWLVKSVKKKEKKKNWRSYLTCSTMLQMLLKSVYIQLHSFFIWCTIVLKLFPITLIYHYISVV